MAARLRQQSTPDPPPPAWWTRPMTREQWMQTAAERAKELNAVTTTQHVQRGEGDK